MDIALRNETLDLSIFEENSHSAAEKRIFVNRNLRLEKIGAVGFDMDYTLAAYSRAPIETLAFECTRERLIRELGYPEEILNLAYDENFAIRGLVIDTKLGNIFKMDRHGHVGRVYHGREALPKETRKSLYREQRIRIAADRYHLIDTLFSLPEAVLYAEIIELYEKKMGHKVAYKKLFLDIRNTMDACHRDGTLKNIIEKDIGTYLQKDPRLPLALHKLRSSGKKLFLLTNSLWTYTDVVMKFLLHDELESYPDWSAYFDIVIVGSDKPNFFLKDSPFYRVDTSTGIPTHSVEQELRRGSIVQGGSVKRLEQSLHLPGEQILYVGDHIYGDIIRSKKNCLWRTGLVVEELELELKKKSEIQSLQAELLSCEDEQERLDYLLQAGKVAILQIEENFEQKRRLRLALDKKRKELEQIIERRSVLENEISNAFNPYWGSVFRSGHEPSRFARQLEEYSCIYMSRVSNFLDYSPMHYFRAPRHFLPHDKV